MLKTTTFALLAITAAATIGGCNKGGDVSYGSIAHNLTPELNSASMRRIDEHRNEHVVYNSNLRLMTDDINRVLLTDNPSRLSHFPITDTSGQPR